ncbi:MAG: hypothetical protein ACMZI2_06890 [Candidatus Symbiodolus clandestinus]
MVDVFRNVKKTLNSLLLAENKYGYTLLHLAVEQGDFDRMKELVQFLQQKLDPETLQKLLVAKNKNKHNLLHMVSMWRNLEEVKTLIKYLEELEDQKKN